MAELDLERVPRFPTLEFESSLWAVGLTRLAGIDEVGRGALAEEIHAVLGALDNHLFITLRGLQGLVSPPDASPSPSVAVSPSPSPEPSETGSPPASPTATPEPTPTPAPTPAPAPTPVTYIVQQGDTLNAIAARFGTTAMYGACSPPTGSAIPASAGSGIPLTRPAISTTEYIMVMSLTST